MVLIARRTSTELHVVLVGLGAVKIERNDIGNACNVWGSQTGLNNDCERKEDCVCAYQIFRIATWTLDSNTCADICLFFSMMVCSDLFSQLTSRYKYMFLAGVRYETCHWT
jgi:hypothetical protein